MGRDLAEVKQGRHILSGQRKNKQEVKTLQRAFAEESSKLKQDRHSKTTVQAQPAFKDFSPELTGHDGDGQTYEQDSKDNIDQHRLFVFRLIKQVLISTNHKVLVTHSGNGGGGKQGYGKFNIKSVL